MIGAFAGYNNKGSNNTMIGANAGFGNVGTGVTGTNNTGIGRNTQLNEQAGSGNISLGTSTLFNNRNGNNNIAIGNNAMLGTNNTSHSDNVAIGAQALQQISNGSKNIAIGNNAIRNATIATNNIAIGDSSLSATNNANNNIAIGIRSLNKIKSGDSNVSIGMLALANDTNSNNSVAIGFNAGTDKINGDNNVFLGTNATATLNGINNSAAIGANAKVASSNAFILGDTANTNLKIGIGTANPLQKLHVKGNTYFNGKVGIGNVAGNYPLEVTGFYNQPSLVYGYFNSAGLSGQGNFNNVPISIRASDKIVGSEFLAVSDARVKNIKGITNDQEDLITLSKIEITNYKMKDSIAKGNQEIKKVIAQQVAQVYPQAINMITDFIPNIYCTKTIKNGKINLDLKNISINDKIKLITKDNVIIATILEIGENYIEIDNKEIEGEIFLYGTQVSDFHTVDYEALTALNISATQALLKKVTELEAINKNLMKTFLNLENRLGKIEDKHNNPTNSASSK